MAMLLVRPVPVAAGALEVGLFALGDLVDVDAVAAWWKPSGVQHYENPSFCIQPRKNHADLLVHPVEDGPAGGIWRGCENRRSRCRAVRTDRWLSIATLLAAPRDDQRPAKKDYFAHHLAPLVREAKSHNTAHIVHCRPHPRSALALM